MLSKLKLFSGSASVELSQEVAKILGIKLSETEIFKFSNDDTFVKINENIRGSDAFIIQSTCRPVNDNLMELLIMIDALKRASAKRITIVNPYYGYARSDKKDQPRVPITAKLVADILTVAGGNRLVTMDLHAEQIQGFFNIPVDHLYGTPLFAKYFKSMGLKEEEMVIVSPDSGGANRARALAKRLNCSLAIGDKRRTGNDNNAEVLNVIGDVKGKICILYDDIIDTGGSLMKISNKLFELDAKHIYAACTHGVLSGNAIDKLTDSHIEKLFITDSIPLSDDGKLCNKIECISIAEILSVAIRGIHLEESISELFF